jgi:hypothetical protein
MAVVLHSDGSFDRVSPANKATGFSLEEVYSYVQTDMVQVVMTRDGRIMVIDEEGKLKGKPVNQTATRLYIYGDSDPIVGDVVVCNEQEFK